MVPPDVTTCEKCASGRLASSATEATDPPRNTRIDETRPFEQRTANLARRREAPLDDVVHLKLFRFFRACFGLTPRLRLSIMMMMRTTLTLQDDVLMQAKRQAAQENRPLKEIINEALRRGLQLSSRRTARPFKFTLKTVPGTTMPGVDLTDRDKLFDLMDGR